MIHLDPLLLLLDPFASAVERGEGADRESGLVNDFGRCCEEVLRLTEARGEVSVLGLGSADNLFCFGAVTSSCASTLRASSTSVIRILQKVLRTFSPEGMEN
jgi:hypothetical protein